MLRDYENDFPSVTVNVTLNLPKNHPIGSNVMLAIALA